VYADFDKDDKLIGIEIFDASEYIENKFEFDLSPMKQLAK